MIIGVECVSKTEEGEFGFYVTKWHGSQLTQCGITEPYQELVWINCKDIKTCIQKHHAAVCKIREVPQDY